MFCSRAGRPLRTPSRDRAAGKGKVVLRTSAGSAYIVMCHSQARGDQEKRGHTKASEAKRQNNEYVHVFVWPRFPSHGLSWYPDHHRKRTTPPQPRKCIIGLENRWTKLRSKPVSPTFYLGLVHFATRKSWFSKSALERFPRGYCKGKGVVFHSLPNFVADLYLDLKIRDVR